MEEKYNIDIIEDSEIVRSLLSYELSKNPNYNVSAFVSGDDYFSSNPNSDVLILDYHLDSENSKAENGLDIMKKAKKNKTSLPVIFFSGQSKLNVVIQIIKKGATDYLLKDSDTFIEDVLYAINELTSHKRGVVRLDLWKKSLTRTLLAILAIAFCAFTIAWI
ncbi:MAG: FixJ family two-component response regulator [Parvicellaceae bacterium]|jgi:FixJ family two-component response regulator